jgi:mRNA-degrading endonuclease RelE of RelBE toxin-antitoxin system
MYDIRYTQPAIDDLKTFRKHEQQLILEGILAQLSYEPTTETRNRKLLRLNPTATWELRLGDIRVLYNVDSQIQIVEIQRVGEKRRTLFSSEAERKTCDDMELSCLS